MADPLFRYLDTNLDGTGTKNAIGDYSSAVTKFGIRPPKGVVYDIERVVVYIEDGLGFRAERYAALSAALTNGIYVREYSGDSDLKWDYTDGLPIQSNGGWGRTCFDVEVKAWGAGNEVLLARWTFGKSGEPVILTGRTLDTLVFELNDDFTGLVDHTFMVQGTQATPIGRR